MFILSLTFVGLSWLFERPALAESSYCSEELKTAKSVNKSGKDSPLKIGSVSKIFTTAWVLDVLGADHRFRTRVQVWPTGSQTVAVQIFGSRDPYLSGKTLSQIFLELRKRNVDRVSHFYFDDAFVFLRFPSQWSHKAHPKDAQTGEDLASFFRDLRSGIETSDLLTGESGILQMTVDKWSRTNKAQNPTAPVEMTLESVPTLQMLQEMNRDSNNATSQRFFLNLGGESQMRRYLTQLYGKDAKLVRLWTGSGMPVGAGVQRRDNVATCRSVLRILRYLDEKMKTLGKSGVQELLAVVGAEAGGAPESTVSRFYGNDETEQVLAGKTGTLNTAVSLAGTLSTATKGEIFFSMVYSIRPKRSSAAVGRNHIRQQINKWLAQFGQGPHFGILRERFNHLGNFMVRGEL